MKIAARTVRLLRHRVQLLTPRSPRLRPPCETRLIWCRHERDQNSLGPDPSRLRCRRSASCGRRRSGQLGSSPSSRSLAIPGSRLFGWPIYQPPAFFWWWFAYDAYAHEIFVTGGFIAGAGGVAAFVVAVAMSVWRAREVKKVTTYGSARWAEAREIRKAGLLHPDGVLLGRWRGAYLRHHGPEHVLCFAPTRSGKGVGLVVPTLLTWPGSAIVHDIKGENWGLTAGWRARFGRVLLFDPTNTEERRLQSAARGPSRRVGGPRRPEHRRRAGRSRRRAGEEEPLGEDEPFAARRHHPACALRREGQDARRRRQLPLRSEAADRDDAAGDDDDATSRDERRASRRRQRRARTAQQERERTLRRVVDGHVVPWPLSRSGRRRRHSGAATGASAISSRPSVR